MLGVANGPLSQCGKAPRATHSAQSSPVVAADNPDSTSKRGRGPRSWSSWSIEASNAPVGHRCIPPEGALDLLSAEKMTDLLNTDAQQGGCSKNAGGGEHKAPASSTTPEPVPESDLSMQSLLNYLRRLNISEEEIRTLISEGVTTIAKFESLSVENLAVLGINIVERKAARATREANERERNRLPTLLLDTDISPRGRGLLIQHVPSMQHFQALDLDAMVKLGLDIMDRQLVLDLQARESQTTVSKPRRISSVLCCPSVNSQFWVDELSLRELGLVGCIAASAAAVCVAYAAR